jgi:hypothetical protein
LRPCWLLFSLALISPFVCFSQAIPQLLVEDFAREFHFSQSDFAKVRAGKAVAQMVSSTQPDDLRLGGLVLINVSSDQYIKSFQDMDHFQLGRRVVRTRRFSNPPVEADLSDMSLADLKPSDLRACQPGHCAYKLPAESMTALRTRVHWDAPDATSQAAELIRHCLVSYLKSYAREGDSALVVYNDGPAPYPLAHGLQELFASEPGPAQAMPALTRFAKDYPAHRPPATDDFFYWQQAAFGLRQFLRVQHVLIQKLPVPGDAHYAIISKMVYASHYFRATIEFIYVYPVKTASGAPAIYVATVQHSFVDGMTGVLGTLIRRLVLLRSPYELELNLNVTKARLEQHQ